MKYLPFKILTLCVLLPPILYIVSLQSIESYLHDRYLRELENTYLGQTAPLLNGSIRLKDAIAANISRFLQSHTLLAMGVKATVTVATKQGRILYPPVFEEENPLGLPEPISTAAENYDAMSEGLLLELNLSLEHNTRLANGLLVFYILTSVLVLNRYYRRGLKKAAREEQDRMSEIQRLQELETERLHGLSHLESEKERLVSQYERMKRQFEDMREKANRNEDQMIEEIVDLEEKINGNLAQQKQQQDEIETLKEKLARYEKEKPKIRIPEVLQKRFKAIYKHVSVQDRALDGFSGLTDNLKIKAEEVIHQLNQDPSLVPIKRKVFGKKGRETVLEVVFAYKGRLYFRRLPDNRIEVLAIGTKNVQSKDLEFLDRL